MPYFLDKASYFVYSFLSQDTPPAGQADFQGDRMNEHPLYGVILRGATIIEVRRNGTTVAGKIEQGWVNSILCITISWRQFNVGNQKMLLTQDRWEIERVENVIFLKQKGVEIDNCDTLCLNISSYTIVLPT